MQTLLIITRFSSVEGVMN